MTEREKKRNNFGEYYIHCNDCMKSLVKIREYDGRPSIKCGRCGNVMCSKEISEQFYQRMAYDRATDI